MAKEKAAFALARTVGGLKEGRGKSETFISINLSLRNVLL